jgi:hypothetical protein
MPSSWLPPVSTAARVWSRRLTDTRASSHGDGPRLWPSSSHFESRKLSCESTSWTLRAWKSLRCTLRHSEVDSFLGSPLCNERFDYEALSSGTPTQQHSGTDSSRQRAATWPRSSKLSARTFRVPSFSATSKSLSSNTRGLVHFHAIIRLDGPRGPEDMPPAGASAKSLNDRHQPGPPTGLAE